LKSTNKEELFNLRHAEARNVMEQIFGVLKREWAILVRSLDYSMDIPCTGGIAQFYLEARSHGT
jgi:hypothetical protein